MRVFHDASQSLCMIFKHDSLFLGASSKQNSISALRIANLKIVHSKIVRFNMLHFNENFPKCICSQAPNVVQIVKTKFTWFFFYGFGTLFFESLDLKNRYEFLLASTQLTCIVKIKDTKLQILILMLVWGNHPLWFLVKWCRDLWWRDRKRHIE